MNWPSDANKGSYSAICRNNIYPFMTFFEYLSFLDFFWKCWFSLNFSILVALSVSYLQTGLLYLQRAFSFVKTFGSRLSYGILKANSGALRGARLEGKGKRTVLSSILGPRASNIQYWKSQKYTFRKWEIQFSERKNMLTGKFWGAPDWKAKATALSLI